MATETVIKDGSANPAPLGLAGFGMTTLMLNVHNAGFYPLNAMILGMGIFVGGIAQVIAGVQECRKGNTFGATAFTAYGSFWLSLVAIWALPRLGVADAAGEAAMGCYLALWGLFTFGMFFATLRLNAALQAVFGTLTILFWLLAAADFAGSATLKTVAGWEGILCGLSALYACIAQVLNEVYGRTVLPLFPVATRKR
jgi:uncharacterized protein